MYENSGHICLVYSLFYLCATDPTDMLQSTSHNRRQFGLIFTEPWQKWHAPRRNSAWPTRCPRRNRHRSMPLGTRSQGSMENFVWHIPLCVWKIVVLFLYTLLNVLNTCVFHTIVLIFVRIFVDTRSVFPLFQSHLWPLDYWLIASLPGDSCSKYLELFAIEPCLYRLYPQNMCTEQVYWLSIFESESMGEINSTLTSQSRLLVWESEGLFL